MTMKSPSQRRSRRVDIARKTPRIPSAAVIENSYMLPHGTRPAQTPRRTTPRRSVKKESQVRAMPTLAARRPGSCEASTGVSTRVITAAPPSLSTTSLRAAADVGLFLPRAKDAAKQSIASVNEIMAA
jgi:hypothetical protein